MTQLLIFLLLPLGAGAIAGLGAAAGLLGQGINAVFNRGANRKAQRLAQEAYTRERQDNLSDWTRQNAYNHPSEQMKRLKEAGLNPNLVYGNGATTTAGSVAGAKQQVPQTNATQLNLGGIVQQFIATMQMQQQTDNLRELNKSIVLKNLLTEGQITRTNLGAKADALKLNVLPEQLQLGLTAQQLSNDLKNAQITYTFDENQRRILLSSQSLKEGFNRLLQQALQRNLTQAQINQVNQSINNLKKDSQIKDFEIQLNKANITRSDPAYMRIMAELWNKYSPKFLH